MPSSFSLRACLKSAFTVARKNHWLWIFGFFIGSSLLILDFDKINFVNVGQMSLSGIFTLLKQQLGVGGFSTMMIIGVVLVLFFVFLSIYARSSLIFGLSQLFAGNLIPFGRIAKSGFTFLPRIILLELLLILPALVFGALTIVGINRDSLLLFLLFAIPLVVYLIFVFLFKHYIYGEAIIAKKSAKASIVGGFLIFKNNYQKLLLAKLVELCLWISLGIGSVFILALFFLPFMLLGVFFYFSIGEIVFNFMIIFSVFLLAFAFFLIKGFSLTFIQAYLTKVYLSAK
ncbi:MAG: hypothetical protein WCT18_00295 [Patescibacteria group bacterium]